MTTARRGRPGYTPQQILATAVELFNERGYEATAVSEIATKLGLSKSALYHHFASKEALLETALDVALGGLEAVLTEPGAVSGTAGKRVQFVIRRATEVLVAEQPYVTLLLRLRGNSTVELRALERRRAFDQEVSALVRDAQRSGEVRSDVDAARATRLVFGMLNSIVEWHRPSASATPIGDDILALALDGLRAR